MSAPLAAAAPPPGKPPGRIRRAVRRTVAGATAAARWTLPGRRSRLGAGLGAAAGFLFLMGSEGGRFQSGRGIVLDVLLGLILAAAVIGLGVLAARLAVPLVGVLPRYLGWLGLGTVLGATVLFAAFGTSPAELLYFGALPILLPALAGAALAFATGAGFGRAGGGRRAAGLLCLAAGVGGAIALAAYFAAPGSADHLVALEAGEVGEAGEAGEAAATGAAEAGPGSLARLPDPGLPGPYAVARLTYGVGPDRRRPELGEEADIASRRVDARPFVKGFSGWQASVRKAFWGFGLDDVPLNGRVWVPEGAPAPYPLVLVVHGNHNMGEHSDPGYAYLCEHLASHGMACVSVDENFLNGHQIPGPSEENDARGWLLLQHLALWRDWNGDRESPFHGAVDLDRIGLIGHSRGGEAAAIAAAFNDLSAWPDDATVAFDFRFGIRAVVAIAPSDGQYRPADQRTPLTDVSYLVIQGGHDGDVSSSVGDRQLNRVRFTRRGPLPFKASAYLYRANHGQFNTVWGRYDNSPPNAWLLNVAPLLPPEEQRRAAKALIGAFMEATLGGRPGYRELFARPLAAAPWLPADVTVNRYQDGSFRPLAGFEEDIDVTTGSAHGATIRGERLAVWREADVPLRDDTTRYDQGVYLGWRTAAGEEPATYTVTVPAGFAAGLLGGARGGSVVLSLDLARAPEEPPKAKAAKDGGENEGDSGDGGGQAGGAEPGSTPVDLAVELVDRAGVAARLPLSRFGPALRTLPSRFSKSDAVERERYGTEPEPSFQTYRLPLAAFAAAAPGFDPTAIALVRLVFDRDPAGVVILDKLGFARGLPARRAAPPEPPRPDPADGSGVSTPSSR